MNPGTLYDIIIVDKIDVDCNYIALIETQGYFFGWIMMRIRKGHSLIVLFLAMLLLFNNTLYASPLSKSTLRLPLGGANEPMEKMLSDVEEIIDRLAKKLSPVILNNIDKFSLFVKGKIERGFEALKKGDLKESKMLLLMIEENVDKALRLDKDGVIKASNKLCKDSELATGKIEEALENPHSFTVVFGNKTIALNTLELSPSLEEYQGIAIHFYNAVVLSRGYSILLQGEETAKTKNIFEPYAESFIKDEGIYYKVYMKVRRMIHTEKATLEETLDNIRKLAEEEPDFTKRRLYLMVWSKLEEDRITENIDIWRPFYNAAYMVLCMTNKCNAACNFCYSKSSPKNKEKLSVELIRKVLTEAKELGILELRFQGGELSFVREEFIESVKIAKELGIDPSSFNTNASWINEPWAKDFLLRLKDAYQKDFPPIMLSVDKVHQRHVSIDKLKDFIYSFFNLFPNSNLHVHTFLTNEGDELEDLIGLIKDDIVEDKILSDESKNGGLKYRRILLKQGELRMSYEDFVEMGRGHNMSQKLLHRYQTKSTFEGKEALILKSYTSGDSFLAHDVRVKTEPYSLYPIGQDSYNSFAVRWDGEYFARDMYVAENVFSMGNANEKSVKEAYYYANNNPIIHVLNTPTGHAVVYNIAKELNSNLSSELSKYHVMEELMAGILKDPIERLAITCKLLEKFKNDHYGKVDISDLDSVFIYKIREEMSEGFAGVSQGVNKFNGTQL